MVRKLRAGMMPPAGKERPPDATLDALAASLETKLDAAAEARPNPGRRTFQRLNRAEYAASIHDMLSLDIDVASFLPPDTISHNFDNIADAQSMSATLLEGYLRAASQVSRLAVGDPEASPNSTIYKIPRMASQLAHVDGAPFGTRGGISVVHNFPADGEYTFRMMLHSIPTGQLYGSTVRGEQIEVSVNGQRAAVIEINPRMSESDAERDEPADAADCRQGRTAARLRRVHPALRGAGGRSARAGRADARRHADRQLDRGHDAAAPPRVRRRRAAEGDRRVGHAEPPAGLHVPAALGGRGARRARRASSRRSPRRRIAGRLPPRTSTA